MIIVKINENWQLYTFLIISFPAFSSPSLHLHLHSPSLPNYNISRSLFSSTEPLSHAVLNPAAHFQLLVLLFHFSPFIFHTPAISQIVNASKTGTIDYTLDTNVTLPDETRQTSCQIICSLTQFGFREHFVHDVGEILCFPRKLSICRGNIVSGGTEATPPPLLRGTRGHSKDIWVNWIGLRWIGLPQNDRNLFIVALSAVQM